MSGSTACLDSGVAVIQLDTHVPVWLSTLLVWTGQFSSQPSEGVVMVHLHSGAFFLVAWLIFILVILLG